MGSFFLLHTEIKTFKTIFNSEIPTESIQSKMKEHTKYSGNVFQY